MARSSAARKRIQYTRNAGSQGNANPNVQALPRHVQSQNLTAIQGNQWPANLPTDKPYPDMPKVSDTKPLLQQYGASGVAIFSGIITSEEYNPDFAWRDGIKIYEQMLRNDGQIAAVRDMVELPIRRATWTIAPFSDSPRDREIASFVESCLFHDMKYQTTEGHTLYQKWDDILRHALMHLWYGFMAFEQNWKIEDGWVKWANWTPLLPRTVWRWWVGEDNELVGIQQWTFKNYSYQFVNIPIEKVLLFVNRQEGNNTEGVAVLRQSYKDWFYKVQYEKIQAIGIERNAVVPPVVRLPENFTAADVQMAQMIASNMRANELMGVTLPPGWDLEFPKNQQRYAANALEAIQYHDTMMSRRALCQFLDLGSKETGSYALADSQVQTFLMAQQTTASYIEDVISSDAIPRLVDYNFANVEGYPKLKASRLQSDIKVISDALKAVLGQNALLTPYPELQSWFADQLGIPAPPEGENDITATNPTKPTNPDQPEQPAQTKQDDAGTKQVQGAPVDDGGNVGNILSEVTALHESVQLLHESFTAIDAVERGEDHRQLMNPYHRPPGPGGGQFDTKGGGGGSGGGASHGGSGRGGRGRASGGGGHEHEDVAHAHMREAIAREQAGIKEAQAGLARSGRDQSSRNYYRAQISHHEYQIREAYRAAGEKPPTHYKTKMTDEEFRHAWNKTFEETAGPSGYARIRDMQAHFKAEHNMSPKEFSDRMNNMREEEDRSPTATRRLSFDETEGHGRGEAINGAAPHFWRGQQYNVVTSLHEGEMTHQGEGHARASGQHGQHEEGTARASRSSRSQEDRLSRLEARMTKAESAHSAEKAAHAETKKQLKSTQKELERVRRENEQLRARVEGTKTSRSSSKSRGTKTEHDWRGTLKPIARIEGHYIDPHAPPDAHFLHRLYGTRQLHQALREYSHSSLRETAHKMGLKSGRTKEETVKQIADAQVAQDGTIGGEQS